MAVALTSVPASDVPAAIVDAAEERGGCAAALYVIDLDGLVVRLLSGGPWWPHELPLDGGVGPEVPPDAHHCVAHALRRFVPGGVVRALVHKDRAIGFLVWEREPGADVASLARAAGPALAEAHRRTDVVARARRSRPTSPAAEIQENLLPPRLATLAGGTEIAGAVMPAYAFGGDWFDYAENPEGLWLAVADATGTGIPATAPALLALGAFRAARRSGASLEEGARLIDTTIKAIGESARFVTAVLAQWQPSVGELRWLRFGHPLPILVTADGATGVLGRDSGHVPLGLLEEGEELAVDTIRLAPGDRVLLTTDGVWERRAGGGRRLSLADVQVLLRDMPECGAAQTVNAVTAFVRRASAEPLDDDATVVCLAVGDERGWVPKPIATSAFPRDPGTVAPTTITKHEQLPATEVERVPDDAVAAARARRRRSATWDIVDRAGVDSFPASDPPGWWGGPAT